MGKLPAGKLEVRLRFAGWRRVMADLIDEMFVGEDQAIDAHAGLIALGNPPTAFALALKGSSE